MMRLFMNDGRANDILQFSPLYKHELSKLNRSNFCMPYHARRNIYKNEDKISKAQRYVKRWQTSEI